MAVSCGHVYLLVSKTLDSDKCKNSDGNKELKYF